MGTAMIALVGVLAALAVRAMMPGKQIMGPLGATIAGLVGAVGAGYAGQAAGWYRMGEPLGFVGAVVGAIVLLAVVSRFFR
jgi:uncharacterized membrane protein YeaQ/YmgE (transglycosylase-associated protein family)